MKPYNRYWYLGGRGAELVTCTSGPKYRVRILWSNRLGLELRLRRDITREEGIILITRINKKGIVDTDYWKQDFFPWKGYLSGHND